MLCFDESRYWRLRTVDLNGIREQLEDFGIVKIRQVLEVAKSGYLQSFLKHAGLIQVCSLVNKKTM